MLGERIRRLRKQKKLTLEALAGKQLTKGMLSLIENNKAKPSMESLAYIAEKLEVEVSELLDEISIQELREVLEKAEKLFNIEYEKRRDKYQQLTFLIEPYVSKLSQGYESARLLEIYSRCLYHDKDEKWEDFSKRAAKLYNQMNLTANRASVGIFHANVKLIERDYVQSLTIFLKERAEIESTHAFIDPITRLDLDYHEAILYFAVGNVETAIKVMENAITFSKEKRIFYHIDDLYRLAAAHAMMSHNHGKKEYYLKKLAQYGEFTDNLDSLLFCELINIMTLIEEKHDYNMALTKIEHFFEDPKKVESFGPWFLLEKGKTLYFLERYDEALLHLESIEIPDFIHHPFDLSIFYILDSYKALCFLAKGDSISAVSSAKIALDNFAALPSTPFKTFSIQTYDKILNSL